MKYEASKDFLILEKIVVEKEKKSIILTNEETQFYYKVISSHKDSEYNVDDKVFSLDYAVRILDLKNNLYYCKESEIVAKVSV